MNNSESNWAPWVAKAENDLLCIHNNLAAGQVPWDAVCYHAQQGAEKMLRAFLVSRGQQPRRTHDLVAVLAECLTSDPTLQGLTDDCDDLNAFAVDVRYPADLWEPGEADGRAALAAARRIRTAILDRLPR